MQQTSNERTWSHRMQRLSGHPHMDDDYNDSGTGRHRYISVTMAPSLNRVLQHVSRKANRNPLDPSKSRCSNNVELHIYFIYTFIHTFMSQL